MNVIRNAVWSGIRKALMSIPGTLAAFLFTIKSAPTPPDEVSALVWSYAVIPGVTALAAFLWRLGNYKPQLDEARR